MLVDVIDGARLGRPIDSPVPGVVESCLLAQPAQVNLHPAADGVAGGTADGAALLVPVTRLPIVTPVALLAGPGDAPLGGVGADAGGGGSAISPR